METMNHMKMISFILIVYLSSGAIVGSEDPLASQITKILERRHFPKPQPEIQFTSKIRRELVAIPGEPIIVSDIFRPHLLGVKITKASSIVETYKDHMKSYPNVNLEELEPRLAIMDTIASTADNLILQDLRRLEQELGVAKMSEFLSEQNYVSTTCNPLTGKCTVPVQKRQKRSPPAQVVYKVVAESISLSTSNLASSVSSASRAATIGSRFVSALKFSARVASSKWVTVPVGLTTLAGAGYGIYVSITQHIGANEVSQILDQYEEALNRSSDDIIKISEKTMLIQRLTLQKVNLTVSEIYNHIDKVEYWDQLLAGCILQVSNLVTGTLVGIDQMRQGNIPSTILPLETLIKVQNLIDPSHSINVPVPAKFLYVRANSSTLWFGLDVPLKDSYLVGGLVTIKHVNNLGYYKNGEKCIERFPPTYAFNPLDSGNISYRLDLTKCKLTFGSYWCTSDSLSILEDIIYEPLCMHIDNSTIKKRNKRDIVSGDSIADVIDALSKNKSQTEYKSDIDVQIQESFKLLAKNIDELKTEKGRLEKELEELKDRFKGVDFGIGHILHMAITGLIILCLIFLSIKLIMRLRVDWKREKDLERIRGLRVKQREEDNSMLEDKE